MERRQYLKEQVGRRGKHDRGSVPLGDDEGTRLTWAGMLEFCGVLVPFFSPPTAVLKLRAAGAFVCIGLAKAAEISSPLVLALAIDQMRERFVWEYLVLFSVLRISSSAFSELQRLSYLAVKENAYTVLSSRAFAHIVSLSLSWHTEKKTGVIMRSLDRGVSSANTVVDILFLRLLPSVGELIAMCVVVATTLQAPWPALVLFGGFVLYTWVTIRLTSWRRTIRDRMIKQDNNASQIAMDALTNSEVMKSFTNEDWELQRYRTAVADYQRSNNQAQGSLTALNVSQQVIIGLTLMGVLLLAAQDVAGGRATIGNFVALQVLTVQLFAPLLFLGSLWSVVNSSFTDLANLLQLLKQAPDIIDAPTAKPLTISWTRAEPITTAEAVAPESVALTVAPKTEVRSATIEFRDVWFAYPTGRGGATIAFTGRDPAVKSSSAAIAAISKAERDDAAPDSKGEEGDDESRWILRGVSFTIPARTSLAIVGSTGAGKSTIAKLLFRFYDPQRGAVLVGGEDTRNITVRSLRSQLGVVPQDTALFNSSLEYNIGYGDVRASDLAARVREAAGRAALTPLLESLPKGLDTVVGERGLKLSGGERQRVAIARALVKDPPILIADEYSSALDSETEAAVARTMSDAARGRTLVVIAHRLSTVMGCDQIIVLDKGVVAERGTHAELLALGGRYATLWDMQAREQSDDDGDMMTGAATSSSAAGGASSSLDPTVAASSSLATTKVEAAAV